MISLYAVKPNKRRSKLKKVIAILLMVVPITYFTSAVSTADIPKSVVIIDSGVDTQGFLKNYIVDEACFIEYGKCPNGLNSMTGAGASHISPTSTTQRVFSHGSEMASVVIARNPNVKIVMIRIIGMSSGGYANTFTPKAVALALAWVNENAVRLNVTAVLAAMGRENKGGVCQIEKPLQDLVISLNGKGVQVVSSTGNMARNYIDYPACIPEVVAVGATDKPYKLKGWGMIQPVKHASNFGVELDFVMPGWFTSTTLDGTKKVTTGTSNSAAAFAGLWSSLDNPSILTLKASAKTSMKALTPLPNTFLD